MSVRRIRRWEGSCLRCLLERRGFRRLEGLAKPLSNGNGLQRRKGNILVQPLLIAGFSECRVASETPVFDSMTEHVSPLTTVYDCAHEPPVGGGDPPPFAEQPSAAIIFLICSSNLSFAVVDINIYTNLSVQFIRTICLRGVPKEGGVGLVFLSAREKLVLAHQSMIPPKLEYCARVESAMEPKVVAST
jgi:hypothetical protein